MNRALAKIILFIPFSSLIIISFIWADMKELNRYTPSFISISLTIATFSITFSFLQYQFSPYKALLRSVSIAHQSWCFAVVLLSLIPLVTLFIDRENLVPMCIFCIPILAFGVVMLPFVASEETDPKLLLAKLMTLASMEKFFERFAAQEKLEKQKQENLELSKPEEMPMNDYSISFHTSPVYGDPFAMINSIIELALKNGDSIIYQHCLERFFVLADNCLANKQADDHSGLRFSIDTLIRDNFELILNTVVANTKSISLQSLLIYKAGDYLKEKALIQLQTIPPFRNIAGILLGYAEENQQKNREASVYISSLFRQLGQKGIYSPPLDDEHPSMFSMRLVLYPHYLKVLGQHAVKQKDSDFLFRCLDDLGYMGCTAVKNNHFQLIIECLQGIVQLGREARAAQIRCFWRHCSLDAVDHADERLHWMLTWAPKLPERDRDMLARSFATAFSRLHGLRHEISFQQKNGQVAVVFHKTEESHNENYLTGRYHKTVDYSDSSEIKEFKLY